MAPAPSFLTLDSMPLSGKTVFCRIDLNCPVDEKTHKPQLSPRITAHARTVLDLSNFNAKVVLLAHQGRKGDEDFISLEFHAKLLQKEVEKLAKKNEGKEKNAKASVPSILFVDDVCGSKAKAAIKSLHNGSVLLLQNVRYLDDETKFEKNGGKSELVDNLGPLCQVFVLDAFSCAHRAHASVVGFGSTPAGARSSIPCLAGRVMEQELSALENFSNPKHPVIFILGGAKPDDSLPILKAWLDAGKLDFALCGGVMGMLMLLAAGHELGASRAFLEKKNVLPSLEDAKALLAKYPRNIILPSDVVVDANGIPSVLNADQLPSSSSIMDIGPVSAQRYSEFIRSAGSIVLNGPMGVYEKDAFACGTRVVLTSVSQAPGYSLLGGGHTISALEKFKINTSRIGYISLSGKALIEYLSGEKLPGVEMLRAWAKKGAGKFAGAGGKKKTDNERAVGVGKTKAGTGKKNKVAGGKKTANKKGKK